jgi:hypothetical protein
MLGFLLAASAPQPLPAAQPLPCPETQQKTANRDQVGPRQLGDLPDGQFYHAVWKQAAGCPIDEVWQNGRWVDRWAGSTQRLRNATDKDR